jgi:ATP-dependent DNA helicase RecG
LQEKQVLEYLVKSHSITSPVVQKLLDIKESRARDLLKQMKDKGLIVKEGQARKTHYILGEMAHDK